MPTVSPVRLHILRALYAFIALGLGFVIWPSIVSHAIQPPTHSTVVQALLGSIGLLALAGIWRPLELLPLLVFELAWKVIWLVAFAVPAWRAGTLGAYGEATALECLPALVLVPLALPWRYAIARYLGGPMARPVKQ